MSPDTDGAGMFRSLNTRRRIAFAAALLLAAVVAVILVGAALKDNLLYFYNPTQVRSQGIAPGTVFRLGGVVVPGTVRKTNGDLRFTVTDGKTDLSVRYRGLPPALFAEGQGAVATGRLDDEGTFEADQLLAKHDEKYMPPDVVDQLKRSGHWDDGKRYGYGN